MHKKTIIALPVILLALIIVGVTSNLSQPVVSAQETKAAGSLSDQLLDVEKKLAEEKKRKTALQNSIKNENSKISKYGAEIANLTNEIALQDIELSEKNLIIEKLNLQITILEGTITEAQKEIIKKQENINKLEKETSERLTDMYLDVKTFSDITLLLNETGNGDFVKNELYRKAIQDDTNANLMSLNEERESLEAQKQQLDADKAQILKDQTQLNEEKVALEKEKTLLATRKAVLNQKIRDSLSYQQQQQIAYEQSSDAEKKLLAQAELLKQQLFNEISSVPSGSYVMQGKAIGFEGMTGWATGPHLHFGVKYNGVTNNPCNYINCASKTGANGLIWPITPAGIITSSYGQREYDYHPAIDISNGGKGTILAAHSGYITYGTQKCYDLTWVKCNGGFAKYAIICENKADCNKGYATLYWHLK